MYRNSIEAFMQLAYEAVKISSRLRYLENGIRYCSVHVICNKGDEYHVEAYGEEAEDLHREAEKQSVVLKIVGPVRL